MKKRKNLSFYFGVWGVLRDLQSGFAEDQVRWSDKVLSLFFSVCFSLLSLDFCFDIVSSCAWWILCSCCWYISAWILTDSAPERWVRSHTGTRGLIPPQNQTHRNRKQMGFATKEFVFTIMGAAQANPNTKGRQSRRQGPRDPWEYLNSGKDYILYLINLTSGGERHFIPSENPFLVYLPQSSLFYF